MSPKISQRLKNIDQKSEIKTLANGLQIVRIPLGDDPRFYLGATIAAGARYEENNHNGVAHFLEHLMFRGSKNYPSFQSLSKAFERLGGEWNAATGYEHTEYWFSGNISSWEPAVELFAEFFCKPKLLDINVEREVIKRELQSEINDHMVHTDLDYQSLKQIWPNSTLSRPILGQLETINCINKDLIKSYRKKYYQPNNIVICAVGGTSEDQSIVKQLAKHFSKMRTVHSAESFSPAKEKLPRFRGPKFKWLQHSDNEYQIQLSFVTGSAWSPIANESAIICRILADGYFSRLRARLREELGLVYHIDAETNLFTDNGVIDITASVGIQDMPKFFSELFKVLNDLLKKGPLKEEIEIAKTRAILDLELLTTDPESLGFNCAWSLLCNKNPSFEQKRKRIEKVNMATIKSAIAKIFNSKNSSLVILGPHENEIIKKCEHIFLNAL